MPHKKPIEFTVLGALSCKDLDILSDPHHAYRQLLFTFHRNVAHRRQVDCSRAHIGGDGCRGALPQIAGRVRLLGERFTLQSTSSTKRAFSIT